VGSKSSVNARAFAAVVEQDLARKMVFVAGPRQVGKATMARRLPGLGDGTRDWDIAEHRSSLRAGELPSSSLWVLDELHKYHRWRNWLKGLWDGRRSGQRILVTGSDGDAALAPQPVDGDLATRQGQQCGEERREQDEAVREGVHGWT
jgi:hypothetical protein